MKLSMVPIILAKNRKVIGVVRADEHKILRAETFSGGIDTVKVTEFQINPTCEIDCVGISWLLEGLIIKPKDSSKELH